MNTNAAAQQRTIYTIGHSTRSIDEFIAILQSFNIRQLVDIRSLPGSRKYPQFDKENLEAILPENNISYIYMPALGGRRKVRKDSKNTRWHNLSFRAYADYMQTDEFEKAIAELQNTALQQPTAYMCSESVWWRCHRSLVSDYLKARGWKVLHIMAIGQAKEHTYTSPAIVTGDSVSYANTN
jgi:uncharacterized protein (DUF488 family)